ncbi:MAG: hypothetical protein ACQERV_04120 [Bacteroidota bacterium]
MSQIMRCVDLRFFIRRDRNCPGVIRWIARSNGLEECAMGIQSVTSK